MNEQELERELRMLRSAEDAESKWNHKIGRLQETIAEQMAIFVRQYDKAIQAQGKIRGRLQEDAECHYENTEEKVRETPVGTVILKVTKDFIIEDEEILRDFVISKNMEKNLLKTTFEKSLLKTWCSAMAKLGVEIDGACFREKYLLNITWPKE